MAAFKQLTKYNQDGKRPELIWVNTYNIILIDTDNPEFNVLHFTNNKTLNVINSIYDIIQ